MIPRIIKLLTEFSPNFNQGYVNSKSKNRKEFDVNNKADYFNNMCVKIELRLTKVNGHFY
jgi:hypothetical protein